MQPPQSRKRARKVTIPAEILQEIKDDEAYEREEQEAQRQIQSMEDDQLKQGVHFGPLHFMPCVTPLHITRRLHGTQLLPPMLCTLLGPSS